MDENHCNNSHSIVEVKSWILRFYVDSIEIMLSFIYDFICAHVKSTNRNKSKIPLNSEREPKVAWKTFQIGCVLQRIQ